MPDKLFRLLLAAVAVGVPALSAVVLLRAPERVQAWALRYYERHPWQARLNPLLDFIRSSGYPSYLRGMGVFCAMLAAVIILLLLSSLLAGPSTA